MRVTLQSQMISADRIQNHPRNLISAPVRNDYKRKDKFAIKKNSAMENILSVFVMS